MMETQHPAAFRPGPDVLPQRCCSVQAARAGLSAKQRSRLALLHTEQQRRSLTPEERSEEEALMTLYRETILVRAQAAVLLKQRATMSPMQLNSSRWSE